VSVLLGNGDGTFQTARAFPAGGAPESVAVGDFNGDGIPDLAVAGAGDVRLLLGNGDGSFQTTNVSYLTGSGSLSVAVADFNGDGWPDLAVANFSSSDVSILLNDGAWTGPHPSPSDRVSHGGRLPGRGIGVPMRPAVRHPAAAAEAQLAEAAFPDLQRAASAESLADPAPALSPRDSARPASVVPSAPASRPEEAPSPTLARPAALGPPPQTLLDLVFADTLPAVSCSAPGPSWAT